MGGALARVGSVAFKALLHDQRWKPTLNEKLG